jgi:hypothetical protein
MSVVAAVVLSVGAVPAMAQNSGGGFGVSDTGALVGVGWYSDQVDLAATASLNSNYLLDASWPGGWMGVTDQFQVGDTYKISIDGGVLMPTILDGAQASLFPIGDTSGDAGWTDASFSHGYFAISPGAHSIYLEGDGLGGLPAGLYVRFDPVPEPASMSLLAVGGVMMLVRRRTRAAV